MRGILSTGVKLAGAIGYVMLDGETHALDEIVSRVRHFVQPEKAVRQFHHHRVVNRAASGTVRQGRRNKTGRVIACRRKELPREEEIKVDEAVAWVVKRTMWTLRRPEIGAVLETNGGYVLGPQGRDWAKKRLVSASIAKCVQVNLMLKGRLP